MNGPIERDLLESGFARLGSLLTPDQCVALRGMYDDPEHFRSRVIMERYRFGRGEYQYFRYPLPRVVQRLRESLYSRLAPAAASWAEALSTGDTFPAAHDEFLDRCRSAGQSKPTPLLLRYASGDYNCLHQDIYGSVFFPFQVVCALSAPGEEYTGGELVLVEQQPRAQSKPQVIVLQQGEAVAITTRHRPARGARGVYRVNMRHGVSSVREGQRYTLGVIFHDAE